MEDPNTFMFGNNSAVAAMNALQAAASAGMIDGKNGQGMPFYPYPQFHSASSTVASNLRPIHSAFQNRTPFGINDILSRSLSSSNSSSSDTSGSPLANIPVDAASRFTTTMGQDSAVAQAAAMYFSAGGMGNCMSGNSPVRFNKPLAELPGRAPIYWPGIISDDWREKLAMQGMLVV